MVGNIVTRVPCAGMPSVRISFALVVLFAVLVAGCGGEREAARHVDAPVIDIAQLPDIDQTTDQMIVLIEQARAQVTRLVPATEPWSWTKQQLGMRCVQEQTDREGVMRELRDLVSGHVLSDDEWDRVLPSVRELAAEAGLRNVHPQGSGDHFVRFTSDDGRSLVFGSRAATMISGNIACRVAG